MRSCTLRSFQLKRGYITLCCGIALLGMLCGCKKESAFDALGQLALDEATEFISACPQREAGIHSSKVADWLLARLGEGAVKQPFETPHGTMVNVVKMAPNPVAIIATHYDTKCGIEHFVGANDGASTTGLLLALAQQTDLPVIYLFLDGEECRERYTVKDGLHGSWHFAKTQQSLKALPVIVVDMLGDKGFNPGLASNASPSLNRTIRLAAKRIGLSLSNVGEIIDDHVPFGVEGWQSADIIDFDFGPDNAWWHTAEDSLDKLSASSLAKSAELLCKTIELLKKEIQ